MAKAKDEAAAVSGADPTVEEHAAELGTADWALAGLKRLKRWGTGKRVSRSEFERELKRFLGGPMNQRRV